MHKRRPENARGLREFLDDESATTAIEYAIIASVVSIAIVGSVTSLGTALIENFYDKVVAALN